MTTVELSRPGSCVKAASTNTTARGSAAQARDKQPWQLIAGRGACDARARPKCAVDRKKTRVFGAILARRVSEDFKTTFFQDWASLRTAKWQRGFRDNA